MADVEISQPAYEVESLNRGNGASTTIVRVGVWNIAWGVFLGGCLLAIAALCVWGSIWFAGEMALENRVAQQATAAEADRVVSSAFRDRASHVLDDVAAEYAAAPHGWRDYSAAHAIFESDLTALQDMAKTSAEREVASQIDSAESSFNICAEGALRPPFPMGGVQQCSATYPKPTLDSVTKP